MVVVVVSLWEELVAGRQLGRMFLPEKEYHAMERGAAVFSESSGMKSRGEICRANPRILLRPPLRS